MSIRCAPTDHKPVEPSVGFRFDHDGVSVVAAGDTVPCAGLDALCAGADALVHTVIRKDIIANLAVQRIKDTLDYHSSPEEAARPRPAAASARSCSPTTCRRSRPRAVATTGAPSPPSTSAGAIELGDDLHRVEVDPLRTDHRRTGALTMDTLRTPDDRFADLPGYPFEPHYAEIPDGDGGTLRVHYLDEGPADAAPVLLLHGEPSWCYLYRKMIPVLVAAGHRVRRARPRRLRPLRQAGRARPTTPTPATSTGCGAACSTTLDLRDITLVGQDWGGLIGLRLVAEHPTASPASSSATPSCPPATARRATRSSLAEVLAGDRRRSRSAASSTAAAPPTSSPEVDRRLRRAVPRRLATRPAPATSRRSCRPRPTTPQRGRQRAAWEVLRAFDKPFLTALQRQRPDHQGGDAAVPRRRCRARRASRTRPIAGGGHFLQEDEGPELAEVVVDFIASTPR